MSNLILHEATGTWEGSKLYQGSGRAQQEAGCVVKVKLNKFFPLL